MLGFDLTYEQLYTLEQRRKGLSYKMWKESYLNLLAISDLFKKKNSKNNFPESPEKANPELYPKKPSIKKPDFLKKNIYKNRGGEMLYE